MKKSCIHVNKIQIILMYLFAIFTILNCNSIYMFTLGHDKVFINTMWQILLLLLIVYPHSYIHFTYRGLLFIFGYFISFILISTFEFFYYPNFSKGALINVFVDPILLIIYFTKCRNLKKCKCIFILIENVMIILSLISIIFWIMENLHIPPMSSLSTIGWYESNMVTETPSYFNIGFIASTGTHLLGTYLLREAGIFVEPSMYAYILSIAILIELFIKTNKKLINYRIIILFVALLSTASTTNIIFSFMALIYKFMIMNKFKIYPLLMIPFIIFFVKYTFSIKVNNNSRVNLGSSYSIRMDDIHACILAWRKHLIVGNGIGNITPILDHMSSWRYIVHNTGISAGLPYVLATGGIMILIFYLLPLVLSLFVSSTLFGFAFFSVIPLVFVSLQSSYICIIIIAYVLIQFIYNDSNSI